MLDQFDARLDAAFPAVDPTRLHAVLAPLLPAGGLLTTVEGLRPYESDGLAAYRSLPAAVALPETVAGRER
jgi:glycolate oxidase